MTDMFCDALCVCQNSVGLLMTDWKYDAIRQPETNYKGNQQSTLQDVFYSRK